ncbi:hypothetical protein [Streptomyces sp. NPDC059787]|uniref:TRADD-N-associated membrane domain-containing protein n=1 Tax=Streptomyces sp. NPDC059787 TaxID=3346947 RepID=UPI00364FF53A
MVLILLLGGLLATITGAVLLWTIEVHGTAETVIRWLVALTMPIFFVGIQSLRRQAEDQRRSETGARVRSAEEALENALRSSALTAGPPDTHVIATEAPPPPPPREPPDDRQARLTLSELWAVTHSRLDHYHGIALDQAKQSFRNAQVAMGLGFALLVTFVVLAYNANTTAGSIVAGGLGAVSAALAGYVSRTFIRSQESAARHLHAYFAQPLEFSRYLAAERLMANAGLSDEKRADVLRLLVQTMIAGPVDPASIAQQQPASTS